MGAPEAHKSAERQPDPKGSASPDTVVQKFRDDASVASLQEHRAIFSSTAGNPTEHAHINDKDSKEQLVMAPISELSADSKPLIGRMPAPTEDGQGEDVHIKLRGDHPGVAKIGLMQPKAPWAATISEEVQITGDNQVINLHGIAPASKDGLLFKLQLSGVGKLNVQELSVTPSQGLTEPAHYSMKDGKVVESKHEDTMGQNSLGKSVEIRNGKPFLTGFEIQSVDLHDQSKGQQNIQKFLGDYANAATNTPYWSQLQKDPQGFIKKADWAESKGLEVKEHPALWDQMIPTEDAQGNQMRITAETIKQHVQDIARLPGQFTEINETADVNSAPDNGVTRWIKDVGPAHATEQAIDWAKQADPTKTVLYNDYQNGAQEMKMLDQMQKDGKLPDAIGIQLHMDQGNWPLARVEETVNQLAKYGKPIYVTEISVLSGQNGQSMSEVNHQQITKMASDFDSMRSDSRLNAADASIVNSLSQSADSLANQKLDKDFVVANKMSKEADAISDPTLRDKIQTEIKLATTWADTPQGEKEQADYTENLYKVLHSNPHVQGITWWDLSDKNSWKGAPRGWFKEDGSPKLVVARMEKLFAQWQVETASH